CLSSDGEGGQKSYMDFIPHASMNTVHHMLLFGCRTPVSTAGYWDCGSSQGTCKDEASIMYAWARNAPPTKLPKDVGFRVGKNSGMAYFVLQIHYGDVSSFRGKQPFIAGMYLLISMDTVILPGKRVTNSDVACDYTSYPIYPFAFRTHTHSLGKVVSGYRIRNGKWSLIGRQSPQLPQAFYPANREVNVQYGDTIAARCVFTGEGRSSKTYIGGTSADEMCNFYIMYYMESKHAIPFMNCMEPGSKELFRSIPAEANVPITVPQMNSKMHMEHTADETPLLNTCDEDKVLDQGMFKVLTELTGVFLFVDYHLEQVSSWPQSSLQLGQVSGLALDSNSNLVIFHRGDHRWGMDSFNNQARYLQRSLGPIQQSTILAVDPSNGRILKASGRNMFYLPHGITTDKDNNYWVTDVALHQVLKVDSDGRDRILLALGEAFTPGSDINHFCKPTDVAVDTETGDIFVSDGYCNARILKFSADGKYLSQWGAGSSDRRRQTPFQIPHSLVFLPDRKEVCVADRENGRIQCFIAETGQFVKEIKKDEFGGKLFAITYSPVGDGLIFAVNGESLYHSAPLRGFVINYSTNRILDTFIPNKKVNTLRCTVIYLVWISQRIRSVIHPALVQEKQIVGQKDHPLVEMEERKSRPMLNKEKGVLPAIITTLLLIPLLLVVFLGVFMCWRKNSISQALTRFSLCSGKTVGSLNLGKFFASNKGYSRQGFDQLSTEGSDQERNVEDSSDSDNEEYSALPPPHSSS
uniref:Peptidylglycine alpha-amidating monooxygenase n=1 Tax=Nothobranchius furzeri TaxID=105023 RepID=A0A8C6KL39_NOTFU